MLLLERGIKVTKTKLFSFLLKELLKLQIAVVNVHFSVAQQLP